jgi:predicted nucleotidyltransferase
MATGMSACRLVGGRYADGMSTRRSTVEARRVEIATTVRRHRGRSVALFGSVARGDDTDDSDIDFLIEFEDGSSLFDLMHLQDELAALLGCSVDVVSARGLKPRDEHIRAEAIAL